jgi:hypothetical protein
MSWFPIGPDFVYTPRDAAPPLRISRRNHHGRQTRVTGITVDPSNPSIIYTIDAVIYPGQPKGGSGAFRSDDGGQSWTSISDSLQQANASMNPTWIAVHPAQGNVVYLGTDTGAVYVSNTSGASWNPPQVPVAGASIVQIVVDPRNAGNPATTVVYAGTTNGLFVSTTGGASWGATPVLTGQIFSMAFSLPLAGTPDCYVGVATQGVFYTTNPAAVGWTAVSGLLAPGSFIYAWVGYCPANPSRAYVLFGDTSGALGLYTTGHGGTNWKKVITTLPPPLGLFAVAPNSPGDGHADILFIGGGGQYLLFRSIDAGQTWDMSGDSFHVDQRSVAFTPVNPPPGTIPTTLDGGDGGLFGSTGFADPTFNFTAVPTDFSDGATYTNSGVAQNLNHGKLSSALHAYNADPAASAIGYIVCDDTGLSGHTSALGWRGLENADGTVVATTPGSDGVKVWAGLGFPFFVYLFTDQGNPGDLAFSGAVMLGGSAITSTSSHVLTSDKKCVTGVQQGCVVSIDQSGAATQISQFFSQPPIAVAASPTDLTLFCCATQDNRVFVTQGVIPGPATVWNEATMGKPASPTVASVAIDNAGNIYVLLTAVPSGSATPLYRISGGAWSAQSCSGLPSGAFGRLVADPVAAGTLYAVSYGRVYRLVLSGAVWNWSEVGPGLPGPHVEDLWIGNITSGPASKVLLRAAIGSRGVWETDVTAGATDPPARPYVRDHFLDQGWFSPSPDGLVNPFRPSDGISVYHYQCADIKIDAQQPGTPAFFQTDPEGTLPLSHVLFDVLNDNSQNLPGADAAMVHVQVHNRSYTAINNVSVWAVYASAAAGVPGLNRSASMGNNFQFWNQFQPGGAIVPNLPSDSPWTSVGAPVTLSGIDVAHPQVGSWNWTVPLLGSGDPGHYCMAVFLHSAANPINESTNYNVDSITPTNPQIGQKNLHIGAPLPAGKNAMAGGMMRMSEYIEFHNPTPEVRTADLVFDLRPLPPQLHMWFRLSELKTESPLEKSFTGIAAIHHPGLGDEMKALLLAGVEGGAEILEWLERWLERVEDKLEGEKDDQRRRRHKRHPELSFAPTIYRAKPAELVSLHGVRLPAHGVGAALMVIANTGELPPGSEYRFQVQQVVGRRVIGGSTYVIRIAGRSEPRPQVSPITKY